MFSILIPSWNNIRYLQLCVESIQKNSTFKHQIIVHINDGSDGSLDWVKNNNISFTHTATNAGVCLALNMAAALATNDYIVFVNDDMYCLPKWDEYLVDEIRSLNDDCFMLSGTMIEPRDTGNGAVIVENYGNDINTFDEQKILAEANLLMKNDWSGSCWPPNVVHKKYWNLVGGYSIEFSPGMSSDDDFCRKMWQIGCRHFKGIAKSRVYHFQQKSTGRIVKNDGPKQFFLKWGISQSFFNKYYIRKGKPFESLKNVKEVSLPFKEKIKHFYKRKFKY